MRRGRGHQRQHERRSAGWRVKEGARRASTAVCGRAWRGGTNEDSLDAFANRQGMGAMAQMACSLHPSTFRCLDHRGWHGWQGWLAHTAITVPHGPVGFSSPSSCRPGLARKVQRPQSLQAGGATLGVSRLKSNHLLSIFPVCAVLCCRRPVELLACIRFDIACTAFALAGLSPAAASALLPLPGEPSRACASLQSHHGCGKNRCPRRPLCNLLLSFALPPALSPLLTRICFCSRGDPAFLNPRSHAFPIEPRPPTDKGLPAPSYIIRDTPRVPVARPDRRAYYSFTTAPIGTDRRPRVAQVLRHPSTTLAASTSAARPIFFLSTGIQPAKPESEWRRTYFANVQSTST